MKLKKVCRVSLTVKECCCLWDKVKERVGREPIEVIDFKEWEELKERGLEAFVGNLILWYQIKDFNRVKSQLFLFIIVHYILWIYI